MKFIILHNVVAAVTRLRPLSEIAHFVFVLSHERLAILFQEETEE